jgi:hypothetical protein
MGTVNGGTIISFTPTPSLHAINSRMPSHHHPNGCANFTFQIPSSNTNSAERRANHNAVERARRECLNTKFQELAHALPTLTLVRRPSKSIIVQKSLDFIYNARQKDELHDKEMRSIRNENDLLREEINELREKLGLEPYPPRESIKSVDIQIETEECNSDDNISNGNTEEDYELEMSEMLDSEINQPIETYHQQRPCLSYESMYMFYMLYILYSYILFLRKNGLFYFFNYTIIYFKSEFRLELSRFRT